jgi:transcriptional regulator GlxA family with amidase domain
MGAHSPTYILTPAEHAFINKSYTSCAAFITICGGALAALQAGIFKGKTATAPRPFVEELKKSNPEVNWTTRRWQRDGKLWTSGALLNGTDLMAAFATEYWGKGDPETYAEFGLRLGAYPRREVEYRDVEWAI